MLPAEMDWRYDKMKDEDKTQEQLLHELVNLRPENHLHRQLASILRTGDSPVD